MAKAGRIEIERLALMIADFAFRAKHAHRGNSDLWDDLKRSVLYAKTLERMDAMIAAQRIVPRDPVDDMPPWSLCPASRAFTLSTKDAEQVVQEMIPGASLEGLLRGADVDTQLLPGGKSDVNDVRLPSTMSEAELARAARGGSDAVGRLPAADWIAVARTVAREIYASRPCDTNPTQQDLAEDVALRLRTMGVEGPHGRLSAANIRRSALGSDGFWLSLR